MRRLKFLLLLATVIGLVLSVTPAMGLDTKKDDPALFDPTQGQWHLREVDGTITTFYFGNPGDHPFMGDWTGNGTITKIAGWEGIFVGLSAVYGSIAQVWNELSGK